MKLKLKTGTIAMFLGAVLAAGSVSLGAFNTITDIMAGRRAERVSEMLPLEAVTLRENEIPDYILNPKMNMPKLEIEGDDYIGTLFFDDEGLILPVMSDFSMGGLMKAPCRYKGSIYTDNIIIGGRNYESGFGRLEELALGGTVRFIDTDGNEFFYIIDRQDNLNENDADKLEEGEWDMTLFTCNYRGSGYIALRLYLIPKEGLTWKDQ